MASPAQLMGTVSDATGVPLATIVDIDRRLVKAGLRTKAGRGFNAAQMTPTDAARLLTAILASPQANAAAEAVQRYARTRIDESRSSEKHFDTTKLDDLAALPVEHSFVDALAALIASASTGSLARLIVGSKENSAPTIEVFAFTRATRGRIRIASLPGGRTANIEYIPALPVRPVRSKRPGRSHAAAGEDAGDLEQSRRVTERTILSIALLLGKESQHVGD